jgi:hypothetical protein
LPYVCPNIIPYLFEKHNKKFEEEEEGFLKGPIWMTLMILS